MAEVLAKHYWGDKYEVASAGISPLGRVSEGTIKVLEELEIPVEGFYSKGIQEVDPQKFHSIVNLSEYPLVALIPARYWPRIINWYVRDPYGQSLDSYRTCRDAIEWLITEKIPTWLGDD
jgi:protein-tyrosine-phosphatase